MATKVTHQLIDDFDGTVLEPGEGETVTFGLDGKSYEIDLTSANAQKLRDVLAAYISAGRRSALSPASKRNSRPGKASELAAIRDWARANGHKVSDRGRIPEHIVAQYRASR